MTKQAPETQKLHVIQNNDRYLRKVIKKWHRLDQVDRLIIFGIVSTIKTKS